MTRQEMAKLCKALGDENRLHIVEMLTQEELCACKLLEELHITQPTLSHHMKILSECDLVVSRKEGKWCHYSLNCETLTVYRNFISGLVCCPKVKGDGGCKP